MKEGKEQRPVNTKALAAVIAIIFLIGLGTVVYHKLEGWSAIDSAYFTVVTLATIGYGDLVPTHNVSKMFTIFFVFAGVGMFLFAITIFAERYFDRRVNVLERTVRRVSRQAQKAVNMFTNTEQEKKQTRRDVVKGMEIMPKKSNLSAQQDKKRK